MKSEHLEICDKIWGCLSLKTQDLLEIWLVVLKRSTDLLVYSL